MTACLWLMVWFAMEKRKRANFERFWYTHHVGCGENGTTLFLIKVADRDILDLFSYLCSSSCAGSCTECIVSVTVPVSALLRAEISASTCRHDQARSHRALQGFHVCGVLGRHQEGYGRLACSLTTSTHAEILATWRTTLHCRAHTPRGPSQPQDYHQQSGSAPVECDGGSDPERTCDCQGRTIYLYQLPRN